MHHGALEGKIFVCPVKELARRAAHIRVHTSDETTLVCTYWDSVYRGDGTDRDMRFHTKLLAEN